ncbi:DUF664 domain-containing protein [Streptomyces anulatus]|uniref:mycothiol transferase n=1 Tax=Streptomyces anulatus TaxID=1892 RepID=UPI00224CC07C|nr:DUF664 domain-containing protein [Streptomyces anulatus]MCX4520297.1 DinB family protein [Streptomyces anulatus]
MRALVVLPGLQDQLVGVEPDGHRTGFGSHRRRLTARHVRRLPECPRPRGRTLQSPDRLPPRAPPTRRPTNFLCTVAGLTDERARARSTVSELTPGGLVKHLAATQLSRLSVIDGTAAPEVDRADPDPDGNRMTDEETLAAHLDTFRAAVGGE